MTISKHFEFVNNIKKRIFELFGLFDYVAYYDIYFQYCTAFGGGSYAHVSGVLPICQKILIILRNVKHAAVIRLSLFQYRKQIGID